MHVFGAASDADSGSHAVEGVAREFHDALYRWPEMAVAVAAIKV